MKRALALLIGSIVLCSGCGTRHPTVPPAPVILNVPDCPSPKPPAVPPFDGSIPFDAPDNVARLMDRDDALRAYINVLEATIFCFRQQRGRNESE